LEGGRLLCADRVRGSTIPSDHREEFERDFDRAIFSTPVKRMQDKAQVFPLETHDAVRTRLTHSLEVSSVARGLAKSVCRWLIANGKIDSTHRATDRQIEAIAATCGLLHDIGNPPFGHAGEDAIRGWFREVHSEETLRENLLHDEQAVQDFLSFEGNAQTLRLVSKLQVLSDFNGLNFTYGTLSALMKYTASSSNTDPGTPAKKKTGYFVSEGELVSIIREKTGIAESRNPIAYIVEAADDIVYSVADVEDGVKKCAITWRDVDEYLQKHLSGIEYARLKSIKDGILEPATREGVTLTDDAQAAAFRVAAIGYLVGRSKDVFAENYDSIMDGSYEKDLILEKDQPEPGRFTLVGTLKKLGTERIYCTPSTLKLELMGRRIVADLLSLFWEGVQNAGHNGFDSSKSFPGKIAALLSDNYRNVFRHDLNAETIEEPWALAYHRYQLMTDYICGMTDSFAKRLHFELTNG
jgi:dGTPase